MATPHVAGVAALVWNHFPQCTANQIRNVLLLTAQDKGDAGCDDKYGYGIVKARAAYDLLTQRGCEAGDSEDAEIKGGCGRPSTCEADDNCVCHYVTLKLTTDNFPGETSWQITDSNSKVVASASPGTYFSSGETITEDICLTTTGVHTFTIYDSYGDGICCDFGSGSYTFTAADVSKTGGAFDSDESTPFTITAAPSPTIVAETGRRYLSDTIETGNQHVFRVNFRNQYTNPIVVAFINTRAGNQTVSARIKRVTTSTFDLFMQEPVSTHRCFSFSSSLFYHILPGDSQSVLF